MGVWQPLIDNQAGFLSGLSNSISIIEAENPGLLAPVATGTMIVASDYSGQHKEAIDNVHQRWTARSYWLLHLSNHRQARDEMGKLHWRFE
ncbi:MULTISPECIES: hypothetical protein [Bradyrhizobium]|uniref:Uncharacterized protein n=1 Tax=Bradyrhizobium elkanii TaxID=29448 RepID=A0A4U6RYS5_BRAEL|nr:MULTISPECIES: hypothetical protein [Bradyrhizobium]MTV13499.1 hypothetical protein [Bradyrhizobium sp. BR2003]TKV79940.1 hypothetical protein FDV58_19650 [Bradyrhizobium elkanii]